jgi:hypothetical protein
MTQVHLFGAAGRTDAPTILKVFEVDYTPIPVCLQVLLALDGYVAMRPRCLDPAAGSGAWCRAMRAVSFLATHALKLEEATYWVNRDVGDGRVWTGVDGKWPGAGQRRNIRMLDAERPDLAYPDAKSRGTWQCVRAALARDRGVVIWALGLAWRDVLASSGPGLTWFADGDRFVIARPTVMSDERCAQIAAALHDEGEVP